MKLESETIKTSEAPNTTAAAQFGPVTENVWRLSGKTVDEFIEEGSQQIKASDVSKLVPFSDRLLDKLKENDADKYPGLREGIQMIVRVLESPEARQARDPLPSWMAETGFAGGYLLKRFDLIPDDVPGIGLTDDALIIQCVIRRNKSDFFPRA